MDLDVGSEQRANEVGADESGSPGNEYGSLDHVRAASYTRGLPPKQSESVACQSPFYDEARPGRNACSRSVNPEWDCAAATSGVGSSM
jgi:hypothetical protein